MAETTTPLATAKRTTRSRVSNGRHLFAGDVDGRSAWARRLRDLIADHCADLGGPENLSTAERSIVRRASTLEVELELLEQQFAVAGSADGDALDLYQRTAGNLRRLLETLGLERRTRDVTPSLDQYLRNKAANASGGSTA